ncbi:MAG: hypothetical protein K8L99_14410 [Anaerolineae bacterium]|nr:hypothetical protein [Anaerolineae bacterium]
MNIKKAIVGLSLVSILAIGVGAASAQPGRMGRGGPFTPQGNGQEIIQLVLDQTGLTMLELRTELMNGSTLTELVEANGGDMDVIVSTVLDAATERINTAVENGNLTQERADEMLANLEDSINEVINNDGGLPLNAGLGLGMGRGGFAAQPLGIRLAERGVIQAAADQTGLTTAEIVAQIQDGATLADILAENGIEVDAFVDSVVGEAETRFQGRMDILREHLTERLNGTTAADAMAE